MKKAILTISIFFGLLVHLLADDADRLFSKAVQAYQEKRYNEALALYETLQKAGYRSAEMEYNLGNTWYRLDDLGRAALHYERALILDPHLEQAQKNLDFLHTKINGDLVPLPEFFLSRWWKTARNALSLRGISILALTIWWLGFAGLILGTLGKTAQQKKWGRLVGISLLVLSCLPLALAASRALYQENSKRAVLLQKSAILRSAPEDAASEILTLPQGISLDQITYSKGWWQVQLPSGEIGWLPEQSIERI